MLFRISSNDIAVPANLHSNTHGSTLILDLKYLSVKTLYSKVLPVVAASKTRLGISCTATPLLMKSCSCSSRICAKPEPPLRLRRKPSAFVTPVSSQIIRPLLLRPIARISLIETLSPLCRSTSTNVCPPLAAPSAAWSNPRPGRPPMTIPAAKRSAMGDALSAMPSCT